MYPDINGRKNAEIVVSELIGLNRKAVGREGAFADCRNLSSDLYPAISTTGGWEEVSYTASDSEEELSDIQLIIPPDVGKSKFCGVAGGVFYWDGVAIEYEAGANFHMQHDSDFLAYVMNGTVYVYETRAEGWKVLYGFNKNEIAEGEELPEVYVCGQIGGKGGTCIKLYNEDKYTYKIRGGEDDCKDVEKLLPFGEEIIVWGGEDKENYTEYFMEYSETGSVKKSAPVKCVLESNYANSDEGFFTFADGTKISGGGSAQAVFKTDGGTVVSAYNITNTYTKCYIYKNPVPQMMGPCVYKNRVWAGAADGIRIIGTSLASGDNFFDFQSLSTDSVEISVGAAGSFTGVASYGGGLIFFKRNSMGVIYGDTADDFSMGKEIPGIGCIDIKSAACVDGVLYFLGSDGFYAYSGGQPQHISDSLNTSYESCIAFGFEGKYYAECTKKDGTCEMVVYDTRRGIWLLEEAQGIKSVCTKEDGLYIVTKGGVKKRRSGYENDGCEWFFETMDLLEGVIEKKGTREILIRAKIAKGGKMSVETAAENGEAILHKTFYGNGKITTYRVPTKLIKDEAYRIKVRGFGSAVIYDVIRSVAGGGRNIKECD